jgi:hypothetical protein
VCKAVAQQGAWLWEELGRETLGRWEPGTAGLPWPRLESSPVQPASSCPKPTEKQTKKPTMNMSENRNTHKTAMTNSKTSGGGGSF